jgi:hypothetical protein
MPAGWACRSSVAVYGVLVLGGMLLQWPLGTRTASITGASPLPLARLVLTRQCAAAFTSNNSHLLLVCRRRVASRCWRFIWR